MLSVLSLKMAQQKFMYFSLAFDSYFCQSVNSVFPRHCFSSKSARVISLFGVQLSGFIHLSHVKTAILGIVFWNFHIIFFFILIENANNWMLQVSIPNPRLQFRSWGL